ncbi:sensor domain-containing diguanylate cyclase [Rubrivivax sp. A210]|uniref:GGDEF domain-containing protein n=1 Tax=Rubrivivax sp. A210 TaxID=2772301 RepID=UPI00191B1D29|nr:sensor domain-containing diguanylate cyclase [Rubrivivax sp. A210]
MRWGGLAFVALDICSHALMARGDAPSALMQAWAPIAPWLSVLTTLILALLLWRATRELVTVRADNDVEAARQQEVLDALQIGVVLYDREDRLALSNRDFRQLYQNFAKALVPGRTFEQLLQVVVDGGGIAEAQADPRAWIAQRLAQHRQPGPPVLRQMPDGRWRRIIEQRLGDGSLLAHSVDVTELMERERELQTLNARLDALNTELAQLSETDALTGLANRRQFDRRLSQEWTRAQRHGIPLALLILDVDHFKPFNDHLGHPAGDSCLREVAALLRGSAHRPADLVARVGGEEFAILLPHQDGHDADVVARRCLEAMASAAIAHGHSPVAPHVTLSIGVVHVGRVDGGLEAAALVAAADAALYRAKREGRNRCVHAAAL